MQNDVKAIEVTEILDPVIPVIRITNPFNPREFVREEFKWASAKTLSDYFPLGTADAVVVSINGRVAPAEEFAVTYLAPGDNLVICPIPQGGGGNSKGIFAMVAMIALTVFAPEIAGFIAPELMAAGGIGASLMTAGVMMAGSLLIHSVFAPSTKTDNSAATSQSYGIDGAKNTSLEGLPVPVCYGKFRTAGNIIDLYVVNEGQTQNLFMLINAGEGPIASITEIEINDNAVTDFKSCEVLTRLGTNDQPVIPWFTDTVRPINLAAKLTTSFTSYTTSGVIDKFRLDMTAPSGLFQLNAKDGSSNNVTVPLQMQYRRVGDTGWTDLVSANVVTGTRGIQVQYTSSPAYIDDAGVPYSFDGTTGTYVPYTPTYQWVYSDTGAVITDPAELLYITQNYTGDGGTILVPAITSTDIHGVVTVGAVATTLPVYGSATGMTSNLRSTYRQSFDSGSLVPDRYDIRVCRTTVKSTDLNTSDEIYLSDVNEIVLQPLSYPNTALLGIKIALGDQISGLPKVTFLHGGRIVSVFGKPGTWAANDQWYDAATTNPAWVVWDIMTNGRFGGDLDATRLDFHSFKRWADYCDAQGLDWNGVFDSEMNVWDACQLVLRAGHAQMVNVGTRYGIIVEQPDVPVMMFSVANMVENSYKETWLAMADRANEVDITFYDKTDSYKQKTVRVYDPASITSGAKQRTSAVTMVGVTQFDRAYMEGQFLLNLNRYILKTINFSAPMEAIACSVGDLIYVQHDMPNWAQAGRFAAGGTTSAIILDRDVTMESGKTYSLLALHDTKQRAAGTITNIAGDSVFLTGFASAAPVKRLKTATRDTHVSDVFSTGGGAYGVYVDSTDGLTIGDAYTLWDTDVIEEIPVVVVAGTGPNITLQHPMDQAPVQFGNWMFGEATLVKKPFRIKAITGSAEYTRDITAIQYDEAVYDYSRFTAPNSTIVNPGTDTIGEVQHLEIFEETQVIGTAITTQVIVAWEPPMAGTYQGVDVYTKKGTDPFKLLGQVTHQNTASLDAARGDVISVKIVAFDMFGLRASYDAAPQITHTVIGEIKVNVADVTGAGWIWSGRDCRITWRYNSLTHSYEFGSEPVGADAGALDPQFKDYEIKVFNIGGTVPRRTDYTTDNSYTYTFDKNFTDGLERRLRFEIRMRDKSNNLGNAAILTAYNPPPSVTGFTAAPTFESANVQYTHSDDSDFAGALIWLSRNSTDVSGDTTRDGFSAFQVYDGPDSSISLTGLMFAADYYVRIAPYDAFGKTELTPSDVLHFQTTHLDVNAIADGVIGNSKLNSDLQTRINLVDGPTSMAGSVAAQLLAEATARGAAVTTETTARQAADTSLATSITTLTASLATSAAAISTESTARAAGDSAVASTVTTLAARVSANESSIYTEQTARAAADSSLATSITVVQASASANSAAITSEATTRAGADYSNSTAISTVSSTVAGHTTTIATQASSINGLNGQYTVKIDSNGYVAGFGFAVDSTTSTPTSEFIIRSDKFAVILPGYSGVYPFTIGTVGGIPRVIISSALIGDASINSAKIGYLEVGSSNIASGAVSDAYTAAGSTTATITVTIPSGTSAFSLQIMPGRMSGMVTVGEGAEAISASAYYDLTINGTAFDPAVSGLTLNPPAGTYVVTATRYMTSPYTSMSGSISILGMVFKK